MAYFRLVAGKSVSEELRPRNLVPCYAAGLDLRVDNQAEDSAQVHTVQIDLDFQSAKEHRFPTGVHLQLEALHSTVVQVA